MLLEVGRRRHCKCNWLHWKVVQHDVVSRMLLLLLGVVLLVEAALHGGLKWRDCIRRILVGGKIFNYDMLLGFLADHAWEVLMILVHHSEKFTVFVLQFCFLLLWLVKFHGWNSLLLWQVEFDSLDALLLYFRCICTNGRYYTRFHSRNFMISTNGR